MSMKNTLRFILVFAMAGLWSSCDKKKPSVTALKKPSPQVKDILRGKTKAEILEMKYGGEKGVLKAVCTLNTHKIQSASGDSTAIGPASSPKPPGFVPPVQYPAENSVVFDVRSQAEVDHDLTQDVEATLSHAFESQVLSLEMKIKPVVFDNLSVSLENVKYILKYSPVLSYTYSLEVLSGDTSGRFEGEGKVYERVLTHSRLAETQVGADRYAHDLNCITNTAINDRNEEFSREFESQWRCINCAGPQ